MSSDWFQHLGMDDRIRLVSFPRLGKNKRKPIADTHRDIPFASQVARVLTMKDIVHKYRQRLVARSIRTQI